MSKRVKMNLKVNSDFEPFLAPTEGLWGVSAIAHSSAACQKVAALKQRKLSKGFIVLYTHACNAQVHSWVDWAALSCEDKSYYDYQKYKFASFLLPASKEAPEHLVKDQKISLRYIHYGSIKRIIDSIGVPIVSTSANLTGQSPITKKKQLIKTFPDIKVYKGSLGGKKKSSLIIDLQSKRKIR